MLLPVGISWLVLDFVTRGTKWIPDPARPRRHRHLLLLELRIHPLLFFQNRGLLGLQMSRCEALVGHAGVDSLRQMLDSLGLLGQALLLDLGLIFVMGLL